ncbi:multicopper oxidase family protein [Pseudonocardia sp. GCM10023141]|uniref:multicopper oxidase family protein n=1 Tax=Pseudonocardia sp. GCM10023141 TaxID=3252653 RepID=UPI00360D63F3
MIAPAAVAVPPARRRRRLAVAVAATLVVLAPLGWFWQQSLLPRSYSVMDMGYLDHGGGPAAAMTGHGMAPMPMPMPTRSVTDLTAAPGVPDVDLTLTARAGPIDLGNGRTVDGYTLNGTSPGPVIRAQQGDLVHVRLRNESVPGGITLHWHGVDVPNADDGVAGVTQDAVPVGGEFDYRFVAAQAGTFWYHSHQLAHEQVQRGLLGALVITPRGGTGAGADALLLSHVYAGTATINGRPGAVAFPAAPGTRVRVRVIDTDNGATPVWVSGAAFRVVAVDGAEIGGATPVQDTAVLVTAGGRADLEIDMPADGAGVRVEIGGAALVLGSGPVRALPRPPRTLDMLTYGAPAALPFDPATAQRRFDYVIGRGPGFLDGLPGLWWTVNGHLFPDVPMFVVAAGDLVVMHIANDSGEAHPMHLHGHHAVVLARDGVRATGAPWWVDSLDVENGRSYDVAFVADNPGIWMDHCHNLPHAADGLVALLMYEGITTPFRVGGGSANAPE